VNLSLRQVTAIVILSLSVAACGGSSSNPSKSHGSKPLSSGSMTSTTTSSAVNSSTSVVPGGRRSATTTTASAGTTQSSTSFQQKAELPASFTISASGRLNPSQISAPAKTDIVLTVHAQGGKAHSLEVKTPRPKTLQVPPGKAARLLLSGLHNGSYVVEVDRRPAGKLIVGVTPGP
jgi:hypothetical protein